MEPLLHFAIAFALAALLRLKLKWALTLGLVGILPDLDLLLFMHRSVSHSILPPLLLLALPFLWTSSRVRPLLLTVSLGWASHSFLDFTDDYTPILFPISSKSYRLVFESSLFIKSHPSVSMSLTVLEKPYNYGVFTYFDAPLFTASCVAIGLILIALALSPYYGDLGIVVEKFFLRKDLPRKTAIVAECSDTSLGKTSNRAQDSSGAHTHRYEPSFIGS